MLRARQALAMFSTVLLVAAVLDSWSYGFYTLLRIVVLVVTCFVVFRFVLLPIRVDGGSMLPTYKEHGINVINRVAYLFHEPRRGDVVGGAGVCVNSMLLGEGSSSSGGTMGRAGHGARSCATAASIPPRSPTPIRSRTAYPRFDTSTPRKPAHPPRRGRIGNPSYIRINNVPGTSRPDT